VTGIRNERWQWWKNDVDILVVALVARHQVWCQIGQSKQKLLSGNWISTFSNSDLDLDHRHLGSNPKLRLDASYPYSKLVSIGQSKLKLLSGNWISNFSNSDLDLDHRHLGSNPKLRLDVSYPYSKFRVNRPRQTKVIDRKPKVDARTPAADFSITITWFSLKTWLKTRPTYPTFLKHVTGTWHIFLS